MQSEELRKLVVNALEEVKGVDITVLDVSKLTNVTDYMVIVSGTSNRHTKALAGNVVMESKKNGMQPLGVEGQDVGEWVLVDIGAVVVHVMIPATRKLYDLESLWDESFVHEDSPEDEA